MEQTNYPSIIRTERLVLRQWNDTDLEPFAALNADPRVMEYFPSTLSRQESDDLAKRICVQLEEQGWGLWAVSIPDIASFIGYIGLSKPSFDAHFTPAVEVGWHLAFDYWGRGYATEGAKAVLAFGFNTLSLEEIVSFTAEPNERSKRIMEKIGMRHSSKDDFDHPKLPEGHPLKRHVLYRINQQAWRLQTKKKQKYVYKPYSKIFPDLFQKEKERITSSLANVLGIEHIGSSAVPGLGGKGIIDIAISVAQEEMKRASSKLQDLEYEFGAAFSTPDRFYLIAHLADPEEGSRLYHIHLSHPGSKEWKELIGFRDYLRTHPEAIEEYAKIKKHAAKMANQDGELYRKMKEPFFQTINALIACKKPSYQNLCTEFYDLTKPEAGPKEVAFYKKLVETAKGPTLEAMCGSGRLLIPLLKKGFNVEGVDNSQHMLQSCQKRCVEQGLSVQLYNQPLELLNLPKKYALIIIAAGSFQLIHDNKEALCVLDNLHSALLPGGRLVVETFVPWDAIKNNIHGSILAKQSTESAFEKAANAADGSQIIHKSFVTVYFNDQLEKCSSRYEKWIDQRHSHSEEEEYMVRWYHRFEMQLLLEKAGFSTVTVLDRSFELNEQAVVYVAFKAEQP